MGVDTLVPFVVAVVVGCCSIDVGFDANCCNALDASVDWQSLLLSLDRLVA